MYPLAYVERLEGAWYHNRNSCVTHHCGPNICWISWKPQEIREGDHLELPPFEQDDGFQSTDHHYPWH